MPLLETLVVSLGPAIAKSILAVWLKDPSLSPNFTADAVSDFIDFFKGKTSDVIAQRRAARQFVDIGERVAESLQPIFEMEAKKLDEGSQKAVVLAVADTLSSTTIDSSLLIEKNLDPIYLTNYFLETNTVKTIGFGVDEHVLYRRILSDCSQYIVDIAAGLPNFTERTFAELLKRDTKLLEIANQILITVKAIEKSSRLANDNRASGYFESEYRRNIERKMGKVQLFGVDATLTSTKYGINVAYMTLLVNQDRVFSDGNDFVRVDRFLVRSRRLLLLGAPGTGKTTLLQWLAVKAATSSFSDGLGDWNDRVPFFIRLREFLQTELPAPQEFVKHVIPTISGDMPEGWVNDLLHSGRAIVLIDGVDELPQSRRAKVQEWIGDLVHNFPRARYIVTSRPYAAPISWLAREKFVGAELQPMNLPMVEEFISRWHNAVREELSDDADKAEMLSLENNLKITLRKNKAIRNLATNPLLCAMICALHRDRYQQLPTRRVALYEAACRMLLEERDRRREIPLAQEIRLDYDQKRAILQRLAYWMLRNDIIQVRRAQAEFQFENALKSLQGANTPTIPQQVYSLLVERSGIVHEPEVDILVFMHRTFLEYLSAAAAIDERDIGALIANADDEQWREVIILSAGIADSKGRAELINGLILRGDKRSAKKASYYLLAAACLDATIEIEPQIRDEVEKRIQTLIPPSSISAASGLALAGDLAVPYLGWKEDYNDETCAFCISALTQIRGDVVLEALASYTNNDSKNIMLQLVDAWQVFEPKSFAETVLFNYQELQLKGSLDLTGCVYLRNITNLRIYNNEFIEDLSFIRNLRNLQSIEVIECRNLRNIDGFKETPSVQKLVLKNCNNLPDIEGLSTLKELRMLSINGCNDLKDISPVVKAEKLQTLVIRNCEWLDDLSPLVSMKNLYELRVDGTISDENVLLLRRTLPGLRIKRV